LSSVHVRLEVTSQPNAISRNDGIRHVNRESHVQQRTQFRDGVNCITSDRTIGVVQLESTVRTFDDPSTRSTCSCTPLVRTSQNLRIGSRPDTVVGSFIATQSIIIRCESIPTRKVALEFHVGQFEAVLVVTIHNVESYIALVFRNQSTSILLVEANVLGDHTSTSHFQVTVVHRFPSAFTVNKFEFVVAIRQKCHQIVHITYSFTLS